MSVRAYKIIKIEYSKDPSFNLWTQSEIVEYLDLDISDSGGGMVEIEIADIKMMLKDKDFEIDECTRKQLEKDIKIAEKEGEDYINYMCY